MYDSWCGFSGILQIAHVLSLNSIIMHRVYMFMLLGQMQKMVKLHFNFDLKEISEWGDIVQAYFSY